MPESEQNRVKTANSYASTCTNAVRFGTQRAESVTYSIQSTTISNSLNQVDNNDDVMVDSAIDSQSLAVIFPNTWTQ